MRGDEIDQAGTAARPIHPALEQHVRQRARVDRRRRLQIESTLKHHASPFFLCRLVPRARLPSISDWPDPLWIKRCSTHPRVFFCMPFAGLLETMMAGKFE